MKITRMSDVLTECKPLPWVWPTPPSVTMSSGQTWRPTQARYEDGQPTEEELAEATPDNDTLLKWAARPENRPPQSWFDEPE